jgi:hypothetical protein
MTTICKGSLLDRHRVQLFSSPQHTQASSTNSEPIENWKLLASSMDSSILDIMMYTDQDANHLMHQALTDILSAYSSETADGHDDIMRKLNSLENKQTSGS